MSARYDAVVFDLDGTLWDATQASADGWTRAGRAHGIDRAITPHEIGGVCGLPFDECVRRLFPEALGSGFDEFLAELTRYEHEAVIKTGGALYDGVAEGIERLAQLTRLHVLSNCDRWYLEAFFEHHDLRGHFESTWCYGDHQVPKAMNLERIAANFGLHCPVYVGDTGGDRDATRDAGWQFLYADWGFDDLDERPAFADFASLESHLRARL